jgi:hypothetical protein
MMRLYFAHAGRPPCPWLEVARLRIPREFKASLETLNSTLHEQEVIDSLLTIFRGNPQPEPLGWDIPPEDWQRKTQGLVALVKLLCLRLLDESGLYNAAKHGLAVIAGRSGLRISSPDVPDVAILASGPELTYLDMTDPADPKDRKWTRTLTFVQIESNLALINLVTSQIEALWKIARARYTGETDIAVVMFGPELVQEYLGYGMNGPIHLGGMSATLAYYADDETGTVTQ